MASENAANEQQENGNIFLSIIGDTTMKNFNELLAEAKTKKVLSFDEKFALRTAFNDLDEDQKTEEAQQEVAEQTAKPETEEAPKGDDQGGSEGSETPKTTETPATEVKATETVSVEKYNEMAQKVKMLEMKDAKNDIENEFSEKFAFSANNKKGIFNTSTQKDSFVNFTMTLTKDQKKMFYEIIGGIDTKLPEKFSEIGSSDNVNANEKSETQLYHERILEVQKEKGVNYAKAMVIVNAELE